jgi:hypothetical protein
MDMKTAQMVLAGIVLLGCARAHALGLDVGPVHLHGTKVKVGSSVEVKVTVDKVLSDSEKRDLVTRMEGTRVNSDEKFSIRVPSGDLDDRSVEILKEVKSERTYVMKLERAEDDWKLLKIRKD